MILIALALVFYFSGLMGSLFLSKFWPGRRAILIAIVAGFSLLLILGIFYFWLRGSSVDDDPQLVFSTDLIVHFPELAQPGGSTEPFASLFIRDYREAGDFGDSRDELFDPWMRELNKRWQEAYRLGRRYEREVDLSAIEIQDLWERAQPVREELAKLAERNELRLHAYPGHGVLDQTIRFHQFRSLTRLIILQGQQDLSEEARADLLRPMVRVLRDMNRQSILTVEFIVSALMLNELWVNFPDTILADPEMNESFSDFSENWKARLGRTMITDVLYLERSLREQKDKENAILQFFELNSVRSSDPAFVDRFSDSLSRQYTKFIINHRFLPNRTLNRYWNIQQERIALLEQGLVEEIDTPANEVYGGFFESPLFDSNKAGQFILEISLSTVSPVAQTAAELSDEFSQTKKRRGMNREE